MLPGVTSRSNMLLEPRRQSTGKLASLPTSPVSQPPKGILKRTPQTSTSAGNLQLFDNAQQQPPQQKMVEFAPRNIFHRLSIGGSSVTHSVLEDSTNDATRAAAGLQLGAGGVTDKEAKKKWKRRKQDCSAIPDKTAIAPAPKKDASNLVALSAIAETAQKASAPPIASPLPSSSPSMSRLSHALAPKTAASPSSSVVAAKQDEALATKKSDGAQKRTKTRAEAAAMDAGGAASQTSAAAATQCDAASSTTGDGGQSHIVGKWWFGRSNKFVVHCDRRAGGGCCRHSHSPISTGATTTAEDYLTPTQRHQRELSELKRELRHCRQHAADQEKQLLQLREHLKQRALQMEIDEGEEEAGDEPLSEQQNDFAEKPQQNAKKTKNERTNDEKRAVEREKERSRRAIQLLEEQFAEERRQLREHYEHQIRSFAHKVADLSDEVARKETQLRAKERALRMEDSCTMTDSVVVSGTGTEVDGATALRTAPSTHEDGLEEGSGGAESQQKSTKSRGAMSRSFQQQKSFAEQDGGGSDERIPSPPTVAVHQPPEESAVGRAEEQQQLDRITRAELERAVFENESVVWRNRCGHFELMVRDMLLNWTPPAALVPIDPPLFDSAAALDQQQLLQTRKMSGGGGLQPTSRQPSPRQALSPKTAGSPGGLPGRSPPPPLLSRQQSFVSGECQHSECIELRRELEEEIASLREEVNTRSDEVSSFRARLFEEEMQRRKAESDLGQLREDYETLGEQTERHMAEGQAYQLELSHLQKEKELLQKAFNFLETQCQTLQTIAIEHGLVVEHDEELPYRGAPIVSRHFSVRSSRDSQTALTMGVLGDEERRTLELEEQLKCLDEKLSDANAAAESQIAELENIIIAKTEQVQALGEQLQRVNLDAKIAEEERQLEKNASQRRLGELGRVAERVPILESELELSRTEKSQCELKLRELVEGRDDELEQALDIELYNARENERCWAERVAELDRGREDAEALLTQLRDRFTDAQMESAAERTEWERRLQASLGQIAMLNSKLNCPRRDAQCQVRPRLCNKFVSCRPCTKGVSTAIEKGELPADEELANCRRGLEAAVDRIDELQTALSRCRRGQSLHPHRHHGPRVLFQRARGDVHLMISGHKGRRVGSAETALESSARRIDEVGGERDEEDEAISTISSPATMNDVGRRSDRVAEENRADERVKYSRGNRLMRLDRRQEFSEGPAEFGEGNEWRRPARIPMVSSNSPPKSPSHAETTISPFPSPSPNVVFVDKPNGEALHPEHASPIPLRERVEVEALQGQFLTSIQETVRLHASAFARALIRADVADDGDHAIHSSGNEAHAVPEYHDRDIIRGQDVRALIERLRFAEMELNAYRMESALNVAPRQNTSSSSQCLLLRSSSNEQLASGDHGSSGEGLRRQQTARWKAIVASSFRELQKQRTRADAAERNAASARTEVQQLRGELLRLRQKVSSNWTTKRDDVGGGGSSLVAEHGWDRWLGTRWQSVPDLTTSSASSTSSRTQENEPKQKGKRCSAEDDYDRTKTTKQRRQERRRERRNNSLGPEATISTSPSQRNMQEKKAVEGGRKIFERKLSSSAFAREALLRQKKKIDTLRQQNAAIESELNALKLRHNDGLQQPSRRTFDVVAPSNGDDERDTKEKAQTLNEDIPHQPANKELLNVELQKSPAISAFEAINEELERRVAELEREREEMYRVMFEKGQIAGGFEARETAAVDAAAQSRVTLRFLHDAVLYFLLDPQGHTANDHLQAIMTLLEFSHDQRDQVLQHRKKRPH